MGPYNLNAGALAAVSDEVDVEGLEVIGEIPPALNGTLIRNGPNPFDGHFAGDNVLAWWPEAAMLHAVGFENGRASGYRNRWVRSALWAAYAGTDPGLANIDSNPNVNVVSHAGALLALAEGGTPVAVTETLETLGLSPYHPSLETGVTAHPKVDPRTGEMMYFRADWSEPWLRYGVLNRSGERQLDQQIDVPAPAMMHDMAITQTSSVLMDLGVGYDFSMFDEGYRIPVCWQEERRSRLCVVPRHGGTPQWLDIEPCFIQHVVNAWDSAKDQITLDVVRYPHYFRRAEGSAKFLDNPLGHLWRYVLDLANGCVAESRLSDLHVELPRINEDFTGVQHRFAYFVEQPTADEMRGVLCYDTHTQKMSRHLVEAMDQNSEPVFVPDPQGRSENDGWVLVCVYRAATQTSDVRILRADDLSAPAAAVVKLPRRIPAGFHGAWVARAG